ncbi:MAG: RNA polymerase sigma factor [Sandaracinaceae bacterium]
MQAAPQALTAVPVSIADADLVRSALAGDRRAEDTLYRRYARTIAGLVTRLLGQRDEVEDVLHDSFLTAFTKLDRLRDPAAFRPWLTKIAITHVRRRLRRKRLARSLGLLPTAEEPSLERLAAADASPEVRSDLAVVDRVLGSLPASDRLAWVLRYVEGHQLDEVADLSGCSLATAKRRIARAKRAMRDVIDVPEEEEA